MDWALYIVLFIIGSLIGSVIFTAVKVWMRKKLGKEVKSTRKDNSYQRPF